MGDSQWEPLAELYLSNTKNSVDKENYIFCFCSRVFIKNYFDVYVSILDRDETSEADDVFFEKESDNHVHFSADTFRTPKTSQDDQDGDANSCYFSASASHTDNYCSTDEHEHVSIHHPPIVIHSSDSGADISEKYYEKTHKMNTISETGSSPKDIRKTSSMEDFSQFHHERNNSLPDVFGTEELNESWEKYWSKNGERLIWSSWIDSYSDYIDPNFMNQPTPETNFSFDRKNIDEFLSTDIRVNTEILVTSSSPGLLSNNNADNMIEEGWNPLSPSSVDETWNQSRLNNREENDILLSPRCESVTSSIPLTIGTTDSMTNVTRMTVSSYDLNSGKQSSESSQLSDMSSPESIFSSTTSSSQYEDVDGGPTTVIEDESAMDADQYWQILWQKHFQEQYAKHYKIFIDTHEALKKSLCSSVRSDNSKNYEPEFISCSSKPSTSETSHKIDKNLAANIKRKRIRNRFQENLPKLVAKLNIKSESENIDGNSCDDNKKKEESSKENSKTKEENAIVDIKEMKALGLPIKFGKMNNGGGGGGDDEPPDDKPVNLKRSHESDTEETSLDRIKGAFSLMGYVFNPSQENDSNSNITGEIIYRKRHIRLHNRILKMKHHKPKHIHFDDDGNEIKIESTEIDRDKVTLHSSSDDDSHTAIPPIPRKNKLVELNKAIEMDEENKSLLDEIDGCLDDDVAFEMPTSSSSLNKNNSNKKEKKKRRKIKLLAARLPSDIANDKTLIKYWYKRFSLFSKFDLGIKLDKESWFSVTPEKIAMYTAERCRSDIIVDAFCGAGGNTIQFAMTCEKVIAIDIDPKKIEMAKHNATIYGVADRIEFIIGDYLILSDTIKADVVFLSPPWGGPTYLKEEMYDLEKTLLPVSGSELLRKTRQITENIGMYLPRNSNTEQLVTYAGSGGSVEIEQNFLDRKLVSLTAYFGELLNK